MAALIEPRLEPGLCIGKISVAHADLLKAEFSAPAQDVALKCDQVIACVCRWLWQFKFLVCAQYNRRYEFRADRRLLRRQCARV